MSLRRGAVAAFATALFALAHADAHAAQPVRLTAALDHDARLGASTALHIGLQIDTRRMPSPVTEIQLRYPASLGVTTSGLGLAACRRTPSDFTDVVIDGVGLAGCPRNAVMAMGIANGEIRFGTKTFREEGTITVLAGPLQHGRLGLVTLVDGWNPIGAKLTYAGQVLPAPPPYGGALSITVRQLPPSYDALIALVDLRLAIGSPNIVYHERVGRRTRAYRPGGIVLPDRCPRGGFGFQGSVTFHDGSSRTVVATAGCPSQHGVPARGTRRHPGRQGRRCSRGRARLQFGSGAVKVG